MPKKYRGSRTRFNPVKTLLYGGGALYGALALLHLSNGLSFGQSLQGPFMDARAVFTCYDRPDHLWKFVNRSPADLLELAFAELQGYDIYRWACVK